MGVKNGWLMRRVCTCCPKVWLGSIRYQKNQVRSLCRTNKKNDLQYYDCLVVLVITADKNRLWYRRSFLENNIFCKFLLYLQIKENHKFRFLERKLQMFSRPTNTAA